MESVICIPCPDTTEQFKTESNENNTEIQSFKYMCPKGCGYGTNRCREYNRHLNKKKDCTTLPDQNKAIFKYICPKCGYGTNDKSHYNKHLNRKKDCTPVPEGSKRCSKCNQVKNKMEFHMGHADCKICFQISRKCKHGRQRSTCKECGGSQICEHNRLRSQCKECGGRSICKHNRQRSKCPDCQGPVISKLICKICIKTLLGSRNRIQLGICAKCDPEAEIMRTEEIMREMIIELIKFEPSSIDSSIIGVSCQELEKRRPDFIYVLPNVVIVIEIDEDSHVHYESSCEISKISQQNAAIQLCDGLESVDVITIRLNPDAYHIGKVSRETRAKAVADRVNELIDEYQDKFYDRTGYQRVEYYYYHEKAQHHIDAQKCISDVKVFPQT